MAAWCGSRDGAHESSSNCRKHWTALHRPPATKRPEMNPTPSAAQAAHHRARPASRARRNLRTDRRYGSTELAVAVSLHQRQTWEWVLVSHETKGEPMSTSRPQRRSCQVQTWASTDQIADSACAGSLVHKMTRRSQRCRLVVRTSSQALSGTSSAESSIPRRPFIYIFIYIYSYSQLRLAFCISFHCYFL